MKPLKEGSKTYADLYIDIEKLKKRLQDIEEVVEKLRRHPMILEGDQYRSYMGQV